ncbi:aromatic acid exporter family protein [Streptomyces sp. R302]|uniref:FUSC family protein n=1 Tax=unclassified Streptomyces TaxID=2593676 RepID=UPI00145F4429|nr:MULTISPECIES: FUSC family protein [unclassified Streptomyces]NML54094.1 aromatic acid exporter family protein [Streptomyces sp. R301]NML83354.1 aromatic acid exporter family protein [Streptomyces sp. R302]
MIAGAWERARGQLWPVAQQGVACGLSWWVARILFDHHVPLFAPIATLVALNTQLGGRGTNAVRVVFGVVCGVLIGQAAYVLLGRTAGAVAVGCAVLVALLAALVLDGERVTMAQAGVSAVIAVASGQLAGIERIEDVLVGAAVALIFSQLLFPVHPLKLLRRAENAALRGLARLLRLGVRGHGGDPEEVLPLESRTLYQLLRDVDQARTDMVNVARRTPRWRLHRGSVQAMSKAALRLGMLGNSCLLLARLAAEPGPGTEGPLDAGIQELADVLETYAAAAPDAPARHRCVRSALAVAARFPAEADTRNGADTSNGASARQEAGTRAEAARLALGLSVRDLLVVVGVSEEEAERAVREHATDAPLHG